MLAVALAAGAWDCGDDPPKPELEIMARRWSFHRFDVGAVGDRPIGDERFQLEGTVSESLDYGPLVLFPPGEGPTAEGEVFSSDTGATYWVSAQAPGGSLNAPGSAIGNRVHLIQYQYFRKKDDNATLQIVVSKVFLESIDSNGGTPSPLECPWRRPGDSFYDCRRVMWASAFFDVTAFDYRTQTHVLKTGGTVDLFGWMGVWDYDAHTSSGAKQPLWDRSSFELDPSVDTGSGAQAQVRLAAPITIDVPLSGIHKGDMFLLTAQAQVDTYNRRQRESYLSAYLRDPQQASGMELRPARSSSRPMRSTTRRSRAMPSSWSPARAAAWGRSARGSRAATAPRWPGRTTLRSTPRCCSPTARKARARSTSRSCSTPRPSRTRP